MARKCLSLICLLTLAGCGGGSYATRANYGGGDYAEAEVASESGYAGEGVMTSGGAPMAPAQAMNTSASAQARVAVSTDIPSANGQRDAVSNGERYEDYGENPMHDTREETLSTFSLDVDTASYSLARSSLARNAMPNPASVRVEEFVNSFDYRDPYPTNTARPFAVSTELAPSPFDSSKTLLRVAVRGMQVEAAQRPSANLVFLVDVSGSMNSEEKLGLVQFSLARLLDGLRPDDTIALVTYAGRSGVALPPTPVSSRTQILDAIYGLRAGGSTNGSGGIRTAYDLASQHFREGGINRVILASDGDFNVGVTGDDLLDLIAQQRQRRITLSVLGYGRGNYNDREMEQLADSGNGNYAFIDSRNQALRVLSRDLDGALQVIAKDVKVQVEWNPEVVSQFRLVGYENRVLAHQQFRDDSVDAAEIGSGQTAVVYFELTTRGDAGGDLGTVRVRHKAPESDTATEMNVAVANQPTEASERFRFGAAVAMFAQLLRGSEHTSQMSYAGVVEIAREAGAEQTEDGREFIELVERAATLSGNGAVATR